MTKRALKMSVDACEGCAALCCRDLNVWIAAPRTKEEKEDLLWQVQFDTVRIYIRNRRWYLLVKGDCMYLDKNNRCRIYDRRPEKCRKHLPPECERYGDFWDVMFNTPEELEAHFERSKQASRVSARSRAGQRA